MNPRALAQALEPRWQDILDEVLKPMRVTLADVHKLAPKVAELSRAYNAAEAEGQRSRLPIEARIAFSFPRDVPKGAAAVRELVASGALSMPEERPLRVLDLGAGLGAMTWGVVRALEAAGQRGRVDAILVDEDGDALRSAREIARLAGQALGAPPVKLDLTTRVQGIETIADLTPTSGHDLVILGQVLSELDPRADAGVRLESQSKLVATALRLVAEDGALVIVEPALRDRARHLHRLRDRIVELGEARVFAPCLHMGACPMLAHETEWCHEDLAVDLPPWTVPLARAAGLRWQGLTFSYLVLRKDHLRLWPIPPPEPAARRVRFRVVSDLLRSKGKVEVFTCGDDGARRRIRRLDRDADSERGSAFDDLRRGDIVSLDSAGPTEPIDERGRVAPGTHVAIDVGAARH